MSTQATVLDQIDERLGDLLRLGRNCVFSSVSAKGVPVAQLITPYPGVYGTTIDIGTGVSYPLKAERVRRNPHTGWLFESREEGGPVAAVAALGAVRDADLQAGTDRYVEAMCNWCQQLFGVDPWEPAGVSWETAREALWYWPRIWVEAQPLKIYWWPDGKLAEPPRIWEPQNPKAPPQSDPPPPGPARRSVAKPSGEWRLRAEAVAAAPEAAVYLTALEADDFPWPARIGAATLAEAGFELDLQSWLPDGFGGPASLTFGASSGDPSALSTTFVGSAAVTGDLASFEVERVVADNALTVAPERTWNPEPASRQQMLDRLQAELERRGQSVPVIRRTAS